MSERPGSNSTCSPGAASAPAAASGAPSRTLPARPPIRRACAGRRGRRPGRRGGVSSRARTGNARYLCEAIHRLQALRAPGQLRADVHVETGDVEPGVESGRYGLDRIGRVESELRFRMRGPDRSWVSASIPGVTLTSTRTTPAAPARATSSSASSTTAFPPLLQREARRPTCCCRGTRSGRRARSRARRIPARLPCETSAPRPSPASSRISATFGNAFVP